MHKARQSHTATLLPDGRVLIAGGETLDTPRKMLDSVEIYDPDADTWTELTELPSSRANHTATLLDDGLVLIAGGGVANAVGLPAGRDVRDDAILYDAVAGAPVAVVPLVQARHFHRAARLPSGKILLVGGANDVSAVVPSQGTQNPQPFGDALASSELYDPSTRSFSAGASMREPRYAFAMVTLPTGQLLATGGSHYPESGPVSLTTTERFDEATGVFADASSFTGDDRLFHAATTLEDGSVLVYGGKKSNSYFLDDFQHLEDDTWQAFGGLDSARTLANLVSLRGGGALVVGGLACGPSGCDVPRATGVWSATGVEAGVQLRQGRSGAVTTTLTDGRVLVTGGLGLQGSVLASAEILTP